VIEVNVWNETIANLTLMALGSSAPEILLSVLQTLADLTAEPPILGASTIVGSAAFNLLVITGVSILAVDETPKKVKDYGVFAVTSIASLFAYVWLYLVLEQMTKDEVTMAEGWLTLIFFWVLIILAYGADRTNDYFEKK
jgi:solute carrier family 8 (sodium/calcium exchanger)